MNFRTKINSLRLALLGAASLFALQTSDALAQNTAIVPLYGTISPFYGTISPFYGTISPFYSNISPFYGTISPFYGTISPFYGTISPFELPAASVNTQITASTPNAFWGVGNDNPFYKNPNSNVAFASIQPFWNTEEANWLTVQKAWIAAKTPADYASVAQMLQSSVLNPAAAFWGKAVTSATNTKSFGQGFSNSLLAKSGIGLTSTGAIDPTTLQALSPTDQAVFFLNFYDGLMSYSGVGHVDWWMGATGWTPYLAKTEGSLRNDSGAINVGMLDFAVTPAGQHQSHQITDMGSMVFSNGHGAAVGSLIMGSVDGSGIMGVLPSGSARVKVYDPYDSTGTTNWTEIGNGIQALVANVYNHGGAPTGVINASLGVPGWTLNPSWNDALASGAAHGRVLVIAAGNDGSTQTQNVPWSFSKNPDILLVGSVGVDGTISNFSNRPGEACLLDTASSQTSCSELNKLKYRFLVAPGELILVSDGYGGVSRQSGTSLSAALVSGAVGLLQTRWPWLANYPDETVSILLKSATPLGAHPGADPVYGAGELNIAASQAPLDWNSLKVWRGGRGDDLSSVSLTSVLNKVKNGTQSSWDASKLYFVAYEKIGATYRDFQIPLANTLVGQHSSDDLGGQLFQSYLTTNLKAWVAGGAGFADGPAIESAMAGFYEDSVDLGQSMGMRKLLRIAPAETPAGYVPSGIPYEIEYSLVGANHAFRFGFGGGASALNGQSGLAERSDFQTGRGGANPLLGLASGGSFADWRFTPGSSRLAFDIGFTQRSDRRDPSLFQLADPSNPAAVYAADATHLGAAYRLTDRFNLTAGLTRLHEATGLLGMQSLDPQLLHDGSVTTGLTIGFDTVLPWGVTFSGASTTAKTVTAAGDSLHTASNGLTSVASELAVSKTNVLSIGDRLRLTVSQPLHVVGGDLAYKTWGVVDRQTGRLGVISEGASIGSGHAPIAGELMYGRLFPSQSSEVSFYLRGSTASDVPGDNHPNTVLGGKYRVAF